MSWYIPKVLKLQKSKVIDIIKDKAYMCLVPDRKHDGHVAIQGREKNAVTWSGQHTPERVPRDPHTTDELVIGAVTWHTSAVRLDNSRQQREERRTQVYHALVHDQNVHCLNNHDKKLTMRYRMWRFHYDIVHVNKIQQVAQLSQRDRAAGWFSNGQKWKTGTMRDNIYGQHRPIFNHCDVFGQQRYRNRRKNAK